MRKLFLLLLLLVLTLGARAMSFEEAQRHALFLSDKMAYELGLTAGQYDEVYQINHINNQNKKMKNFIEKIFFYSKKEEKQNQMMK